MQHPGVLQTVRIDMVEPNEWNPNVVTESMQQQLAANIERVGMNAPILVRPVPDRDALEIVDGEHRWRAAKAAGATEIDVVIVALSDAEAKAQTIAMNRLRGSMDEADLARLTRQIESEGISLQEQTTFIGIPERELRHLERHLHDPDAGPDPDQGREPWVQISLTVPVLVAELWRQEIARVREIVGTEHDHLALEAILACSRNTPEENF